MNVPVTSAVYGFISKSSVARTGSEPGFARNFEEELFRPK